MTQLEIEFKTLLSEAQFNQMMESFKHAKVIKQINHYYQYSDSSVYISCRIRTIEHTHTLTFKQDHPEGRLETDFQDVDENAFERADVKEFLNKNLLTKYFKPIGSLLTYRKLIKEDHLEICIDENHYLGKVDYELEVESIDSPTMTEQRFNELCERFDIKDKVSISKYKRFLNQKGLK